MPKPKKPSDEPKKRPGRPPMDPSQKKDKKSIHVTLEKEVWEALRLYCKSHPFDPDMTKVVEIAVEEYLARNSENQNDDIN